MDMCRRSLALPETVEEQQMKVDLQKRIAAHVKVVLRRADKQKIPMEIPEAREIATAEIIDTEGKLERARVKEDMVKQANAITAAEEERARKEKDNEKKTKKRKRKWAATVLQSYYRMYLAYKEARRVTYTRFKKHFDVTTMAYFYENLRDRTCSWKKPGILGSYDIDCDDAWLVITDSEGYRYFYNPCTWVSLIHIFFTSIVIVCMTAAFIRSGYAMGYTPTHRYVQYLQLGFCCSLHCFRQEVFLRCLFKK
jgi:hypothetical protein